MNQIPVERETDIMKQRLADLIEKTPHHLRQGISEAFQGKLRKLAQSYTPVDPQYVLQKLLDKTPLLQSRKNWKMEETNYLIYVIDKYCLLRGLIPEDFDQGSWADISEYLPGRTSEACQFRFLALAPPSITQTPWASEERELLLRIIQNQKSSSPNWKLISQKLYQVNPTHQFRTGKQCREHYSCFLKPNLKKGSWTEEQDYELITLFLRFGKKWSKMARHIQGRNENSIKNRFFLMFENKKDGRLTNSDLIKVVRRRKQKIEKKLQKNFEETLDQKLLLTSVPSESYKSDNQEANDEHESVILEVEQEVFVGEPQNQEQICLGPEWEPTSYEFQQFITF